MSVHCTQFSSLPAELRIEIHGLALDRSPRNVEVEIRDGRVVSKTRPPALHVHRDSRALVLEIYKPWLPQFAELPAHAPYAALLKRYLPSKILGNNTVSCLNDVCFDMERDILLCKTRWLWLLYLFGRIEECFLKKLAVNIDGWLVFSRVVEALRKAKHLDKLYLFQDALSDGIYYKVGRISDGLGRIEGKDQVKPKERVPNYVAPLIYTAITSSFVPSWVPTSKPWKNGRMGIPLTPHNEPIVEPSRHTSPWTTYRYRARSSSTLTLPSTEVKCNPMQQPSSKKRKADTNPETMLTGEPRLSERTKRIKMWTRSKEMEEAKGRPPFADLFHLDFKGNESRGFTAHFSNRSAPSTGQSSSRAGPQSEVASQNTHGPFSDAESVLEESAESESGDSASSSPESEGSRSESPDLQDAEEASPKRGPRNFHAHRFNFDIGATELLVEWDDSPEMDAWEWVTKDDLLLDVPIMIATFISSNPALETRAPVRFHDRNSGSVGFDLLVEFEGYPEEIYWTWVPEPNIQAKVPDMVDEWMAENVSEFETGGSKESVDDQILAEQNYAENNRSRGEDNQVDELSEVADAGDADVKKDDDDAGDEERSAGYIPKRFVAQRDIPNGTEILVEWDGWPDEKDWTWEPESNLLEDTPEMVKSWKASHQTEKISKVYEVESILGKRKVRGEWNYVVKWNGFSKDEATSLEPCDRIKVDVPDLVEAFESRQPKRGRPKKVDSKRT